MRGGVKIVDSVGQGNLHFQENVHREKSESFRNPWLRQPCVKRELPISGISLNS